MPGCSTGFFLQSKRLLHLKIGDVIENNFDSMKNPVTGAPFSAQICIPGGMEYSAEGGAEVVLWNYELGYLHRNP